MSKRIPITVGIIGHRDIITTDDHRKKIESLFIDLAKKYSSSPIHLLSSVAEGADRFVANIFLDIKNSNKKYRDRFELIVPMPFSPEEYKKDFDDYSDLEFDRFIIEAKRCFIVPSEAKADRPHKYLETGKLLADSSLILIAMWNGEEGKTGGTSDIIKYKLTGEDKTLADSTFDHDGTVFVLPAERKKSPGIIKDFPGYLRQLSLDNILKNSTLKTALEKIEEINSYSTRLHFGSVKKSQANLFGSEEKLEKAEKQLFSWYSILDQMAVKTRRLDLKITGWMFALSLLFVFTLEIYSNIWTVKFILAISMLILCLTTVLFAYSRLKNDHKKYLYSRTLAEGLRMQFFWNMAGINENVSDYILRIHGKGFIWVKHILSALYGLSYNQKRLDNEIIEDMTRYWINDQYNYFDSSVRKMRKKISFYHRVSNLFLALSMLLFFSIFFLGNFFVADYFMLSVMLVIAPIMLGAFALIRAYIKTKSYENLLNQHEIMLVIYKRARSKIDELSTLSENIRERNSYFRDLFFIIGKEALVENGIWYLIFKDKEAEIEMG